MESSTIISSFVRPSSSMVNSDIFTEAVYSYLVVVFKFFFFPLIGVIALFANIINVLVFYKMGLSDGVTQNYFILSLSDGIFAVFNVINVIAYVFVTVAATYKDYGYWEKNAQIVYWLSYYIFTFPQFVSLAATVVIAVVRSCCVAFPLQVKHILSRQRQLTAILLLSGIGIVLSVYAMTPLHLAYKYNPKTNSSLVYFNGLTTQIFMPLMNISFIGSFMVVVISVIVMARSLRQASKFRDSSTTTRTASGSIKETLSKSDSLTQSKSTERNQRDVRIVRTVVLVSVVFIVTNIPVITLTLVRIFVPELNPLGRYRYSHQFARMVRELSTMFNAAVNIFIYYFYNSRFRNTLLSFFESVDN